MRLRNVTLLGLGMVCLTATVFAKEKAPYQWPAMPDQATIDKAMAMKTESGLVAIDWQRNIEIRSYGQLLPGTTREEYIRFIVVNEEGVKNAVAEVNDESGATIEIVEGRTVGAGGTITAVDQTKDVTRVDIKKLKGKKSFSSLASVRFPAPEKGAILDLHYITKTEKMAFYFSEGLSFRKTPVVNGNIDLNPKGGYPNLGWSVITIGDTSNASKLEMKKGGVINVHFGPFTPPKSEIFSPPSIHTYATVVAYQNLGSMRVLPTTVGKTYQHPIDTDTRGRIVNVVFDDDRNREFWVKYLAEDADYNKGFLKRAGAADDIDLDKVAPATLPVEERLAALYKVVQERCVYNPDAEEVTTLSAMLKKGMTSEYQGTLFLSSLLTRAKIPHRVGMVVDRYELRFTPVILNEYLFGFSTILVVELPGKNIFLKPGDLSMPFAALPVENQEAIALFPQGEKDITALMTPANTFDADRATYTYDLAIDSSGDATGTLKMSETGTPASSFFWFNLYYQFRQTNPSKEEKKNLEEAKKNWRDKLDERIKDELELPGSLLQLRDYVIKTYDPKTPKNFEVACKVQGKGLAQSAQNNWLLYVCPTLVGYSNPFTEESRRRAIWYPQGGRMVYEGDIRLPAGAKVVELPKIPTEQGPEGCQIRGEVSQRDDNGTVVIHTRLEYDQALVVGLENFRSWRRYKDSLAKLAQIRCIISMPVAQTELE